MEILVFSSNPEPVIDTGKSRVMAPNVGYAELIDKAANPFGTRVKIKNTMSRIILNL